MGAPLAPIIADIFMSHLEESLMDRLKQIGVCEWYRYVDDTFVLVEPTTKVKNILQILNNFHQSISFTHQLEKKGSLPFLDAWITRSAETKKFQTAVYRKDTFTGLMTKWNSFVPKSYKKASIVTMIHRALPICSTYSSLEIEFENIRQIGLQNGYPLSFLDSRIGIGLTKHLNKSTEPVTTIVGCEKKKMYVEIPYTGSATDSFKNKLSRIAGKIRPELDVRFFARPPPSVQMFFNTKDPVPKHLQSDIVYSVKCKDCGDQYVGETQRQAIRRLWEHGAPKSLYAEKLIYLDQRTTTDDQQQNNDEPQAIETNRTARQQLKKTSRIRHTPYPNPETLRRSTRIRETNATSHGPKTDSTARNTRPDQQKQNDHNQTKHSESSISRHTQQTGHQMDWENFNVVWQDNHSYPLLIKESLVIKAFEPSLNRTTHSVPMFVFPEGLPRIFIPDPDPTK
jgi:hypothetical protein